MALLPTFAVQLAGRDLSRPHRSWLVSRWRYRKVGVASVTRPSARWSSVEGIVATVNERTELQTGNLGGLLSGGESCVSETRSRVPGRRRPNRHGAQRRRLGREGLRGGPRTIDNTNRSQDIPDGRFQVSLDKRGVSSAVTECPDDSPHDTYALLRAAHIAKHFFHAISNV